MINTDVKISVGKRYTHIKTNAEYIVHRLGNVEIWNADDQDYTWVDAVIYADASEMFPKMHVRTLERFKQSFIEAVK
jgi:hypothetical protein